MTWRRLSSIASLLVAFFKGAMSCYFYYRESSIKPPSQISPIPLTSLTPPLPRGRKLISLLSLLSSPPSPLPSPNYSSLKNERLYYQSRLWNFVWTDLGFDFFRRLHNLQPSCSWASRLSCTLFSSFLWRTDTVVFSLLNKPSPLK